MKLKYFDAHTHLNMGFEQDWLEVGKRTLEAGISFVNVGADEKSSKLALEQVKELAKLVPRSLGEVGGCWATAGIHPTEGGDSDFGVIKELAQDKKVVAIGECGLEYFKLTGDIEVEKERQKKLFKQHVELALEVGKPLMIHCRASEKNTDAYEDVLEILKSYFAKASQDKQNLRFCLHFFAADWSIAQKVLELGGYLSFPGIITFSSACDETIKNMPLDRILSETDAPFAAPVPHRGQRNEPSFVSFVAERIASLRPEPKEAVLEALVVNAKAFYGLTQADSLNNQDLGTS